MNDLNQISEIAARSMHTLDRERFPVFVFGPYLLDHQTVSKPSQRVKEHAKYLRFLTKATLQKKGFKVHFGESSEVIKVWEKHIGSQDAASIEISHAYHICGAVVIFASSVGSFCELGLFASYESIISKTIVIVDKQYEGHKSFLNEGLLKIVEQENGKVVFSDYRDHCNCIEKAIEYVEGKFTKVQRDLLHIEQSRAKAKRIGAYMNPK